MYLLPTSAREEHKPSTPTSSRVPYVLERYERFYPCKQLASHFPPEGDIARSLQIPVPSIELDFRMSIKLNPKVSIGSSLWGGRDWVSFLGGQWAGRWGKGIILVRINRVYYLKRILTCYSPVVKILKSQSKKWQHH